MLSIRRTSLEDYSKTVRPSNDYFITMNINDSSLYFTEAITSPIQNSLTDTKLLSPSPHLKALFPVFYL
jgi:hypothetical protein